MKKAPFYLFLLFLLFGAGAAQAQNNKNITSQGILLGNIQDALTGKPIKGATIYLIAKPDATQKN